MKTFLHNGPNKISYQVEGMGLPIVWIHGGGVDHRMWQPQMKYFCNRYQLITYDIRGHGQSHYEVNEQPEIADLEALLDHLGLGQVALAGLSLGAVLAVDFVLAHPERVSKLILLSPGLVGVQEKEASYLEPLQKLMAAVNSRDMEAAADVILQMTFSENSDRNIPGLKAMKAYVKATTTQYFKSGNYTRMPRLKEANPAPRLEEISCPTLVLHGSADADYIAKNVAVLEREIPDCQTVLLFGAGHLVNVEGQEAVNEAIELFLVN
jgi:3-oxoadipate enol-lactonase